MRRHRESVGDGKVGCVVLCAWATAESGTGTRDGDANARALLREATTTANGDARAVCDAWVALGNHELKHGRVDKARKCYKSALSAGEGAPASAAVATIRAMARTQAAHDPAMRAGATKARAMGKYRQRIAAARNLVRPPPER